MKRLFAIAVIALTGCSEPHHTFSFAAGQVLPATIIEVDSEEIIKAHFHKLNVSDGMSNFEKLDAKTTNVLRKNVCELHAEFSEVGNRLISKNVSVVCGDTSYPIDGSLLDKSKTTGLIELDVGADIYLTVHKSN